MPSCANKQLFVSVRQLPPEPNSVDELRSQLCRSLPQTPKNLCYIDGLGRSAIPSVVCQRLSALSCLLSLLETMIPENLPSLSLSRDEYGRPYAEVNDPNLPVFDFNLTHSQGLVGCALLLGGGRVGLDIEAPIARDRIPRLSARFFSTAEQARLALFSERDDQIWEATRIWTAKEALAKQDGQGFPLRFDSLLPRPSVTLYHGCIGHHGHPPLGMLTVCVPSDAPSPQLDSASLPVRFLNP